MQKIFPAILTLILINLASISKVEANEIPIIPDLIEKIDQNNYVEGEVIIKYKNKEKKNYFKNKLKAESDYYDLEIKDNLSDKKNISLIKSKNKKTEDLIRELKDDPAVEIIEPNYKRNKSFIPNDTRFNWQWSLRNTGQTINTILGTVDADIDVDEMWDIESAISNETIVAVIDDGVDHNHIDLINNMWDGSTCLDDLGNPILAGCPNHGWDYQDNDNNPYFNEHGTFVSSLIASQINNDSGIAGLSRYNKIKIMALKFDFDLATEIKSIDFAINNGAKVINASYGGYDFSFIEKLYIESFDGIFVAAAGNDSNNNDANPHYPCSYDSPNLICVASSDQNDQLSNFSNYGPTTVDIMAPGENMIGLYLDEYYIGDGTSFATPLVAGTTALLYSQNPTASISTIRNTLLASSDHLLESDISCSRRLNSKTSLQSTIDDEIPTEDCSNINASLFFEISDGTDTTTKVIGQTFDVTAKISPGTNEVGGAELDINFEPNVLKLNSITMSDSFNALLSDPTIDNTSGLGSIDAGLLTNPATYITETSDVATFSFTVLAKANDSPISFATTSNASAHGEYVVSTRSGLEIDAVLDLTPIYRLYNTSSGAHLYTKGNADRDYVLNKWSEFEFTDGIPAFYASLTDQAGLTPIYRLYNTATGVHLYTKGNADRDYVLNKWSEFEFTDGIPAFYASLTNQSGLTPIYRLYNTVTGVHLYTKGTSDRDYVLNKWSDFEFTDGVPAFYADID